MTDSKKIDDGGPAYPVHPNPSNPIDYSKGMSLRDWFAGQALAGMYGSQWLHDHAKEFSDIRRAGDHDIGIAKRAYIAADAMLIARKGGA